MTAFDAIVLAGGDGRRLGGRDKAALEIDGRTFIQRVVAAASDASRIVCVGPRRDVDLPVAWTREQPPGGGPVAAISAGLALVEEPTVVILAVDLPFVTRAVVARLVESCGEFEGAIAVDDRGRLQPLLAAYRTDALRDCLDSLGATAGLPVMRLVEEMSYVTVSEPEASQDCDTPAELELVTHMGGQQ